MSQTNGRENEYDDQFVARLELIWGEGFLSPGGADEINTLLQGFDIEGQILLDIGCGIGGADVLLVEQHGAAKVIGIDIEQPLIDRALGRAKEKGLLDRLQFECVEPGPLAFGAETLDLVFSKDAILQIPDKASLFADVFRVLKPGGAFVASDWLKSGDGELKALRHFLDVSSFSSAMETPESSAKHLRSSGFGEIEVRDRTDWLREQTRQDNELIEGEYRQTAIDLIGDDKYRAWLTIRRSMLAALQAGELRPSHLIARKPVRD